MKKSFLLKYRGNKNNRFINSFEIREGGFFSSKYASFKVITEPLNMEVYRRYTHFVWLHD